MRNDELTMEELLQRVQELSRIVEEQKNKIMELNVIDELTNLFNRKSLYTALEYEINRIERIPTFLSVLLIGVNDLDKIEGKHGDKTKDVIIKQIAETIERSTRSSDIKGRFDDDVFMVISPDLNPNKGIIIAERIQYNVERGDYPSDIKVSTSAGVKHYNGESASKLMSIAEGYLRLSRKEGKNKLVSSI